MCLPAKGDVVLGADEASSVLVISTERAADPEAYATIVGQEA
jgi:hypothetical protein